MRTRLSSVHTTTLVLFALFLAFIGLNPLSGTTDAHALSVTGARTRLLEPALPVAPLGTPTAIARPSLAALPDAQVSNSLYLPTIRVAVSADAPPAVGPLVVHFLDVGQGDSTLLHGPDFTILIDAGRHDRDDVTPHLERIGIQAIDLLVGTHPHADHIGQFPQVLARYPVTEVWLSGDTHTSLTFERAIDAILASGAAYREPRAHETYRIGSASVEVLNPLSLTGDFHQGSVSVRISFGDVAFVFTGDAEAVTEQAMIQRGHTLTAQILQLGHHGSDTSSSSAFLQAVMPQLAIWSAGAGNSYGHPHASVLGRLSGLGILVCGTATHGTIAVETDGQTVSVLNQDCVDQAAPPATPLPTVTPDATLTPQPTATQPPPTAMPTLTPQPTSTATTEAPTCVNINTASHEELQMIVHIGPERATELISLRPFSSVDDMIRITGIGPVRLQEIKDQGLACV